MPAGKEFAICATVSSTTNASSTGETLALSTRAYCKASLGSAQNSTKSLVPGLVPTNLDAHGSEHPEPSSAVPYRVGKPPGSYVQLRQRYGVGPFRRHRYDPIGGRKSGSKQHWC